MDLFGPFIAFFVVSFLLFLWKARGARWEVHAFCLMAAFLSLILNVEYGARVMDVLPEYPDHSILIAANFILFSWVPLFVFLVMFRFTALRNTTIWRYLTPIRAALLALVYSSFTFVLIFTLLALDPGS